MIGGYKGISFPFRVGVNGGVQMSSTDKFSAPHIMESIQQILSTEYSERPMEMEIYSDVDKALFEPNDEIARDFLAEQIAECIERLEDRVSVSPDDIDFFSITTESGVEELYCNMEVYVEDYEAYYTLNNIRLGAVS